jgi:CBS domain-containing protein
MKTKEHKNGTLGRLVLAADTARDLMHTNPVSIRDNASIQEALALLTDKGFSAAPVIDQAGRPVGVLSRSDLITHDREKLEYVAPRATYEQERATLPAEARTGFQVIDVDPTRVGEIMTPAVFSVGPDTPVTKVVEQMLGLAVHRLFVVDKSGVLIGVISASDILRNLQ